jgi:hypothetical protein
MIGEKALKLGTLEIRKYYETTLFPCCIKQEEGSFY